MSPEEVQKRFIEEINLRAYDDKYIDKNEEREILQIAIHHGMVVEEARVALKTVCDHQHYVLESSLTEEIKNRLHQLLKDGGKIDQQTFSSLVANVKEKVGDKRNERDIKRLIVIVMEDNALNQVKVGWFGNWYSAVKKEVGMR